MKRVVLSLIFCAIVAAYTVRAFYPQQPLHHQLNDAAGVLIVAFLVAYFLIPGKDGD